MVFVERLVQRKLGGDGCGQIGGDLLGKAIDAFETGRLGADGLSLDDLDVHANVVGGGPPNETGRCAGVVVTAGSVVALHPREIALERRAAEELVVVDDARKEPEKFRARCGGQLLRHVGCVDLAGAPHGDRVDRRTAGRNRRAAAQGESQRDPQAEVDRAEEA